MAVPVIAAHPFLQSLWTAIKWIVGALGGFAGAEKIVEWLFSGPKIIGEVRQIIVGEMTDSSGNFYGVHVMLHLYIVNKRMKPTTLKLFSLKAKVRGEWRDAEWLSIPNGFRLGDISHINFSSAHLYEKAGLNLLEYGKGMSGWLRFVFVGDLQKPDIDAAPLVVKMTDAFNGTHFIRYKPSAKMKRETSGATSYFPGAGIDVN